MKQALAAALLAALAGCGGESILVPVTLSLDESTCTTEAPAMVAMSCDSAVGAWVKRGDPADPDTAADSCVDFPSTDRSLAGLPAVLSAVDLDGIEAGQVWLEIAVFAPGRAADGCPAIEELSDRMAVYGRTPAVDISHTSRGLSVELLCYAVDDGATVEACSGRCEAIYEYCPDGAESGSCDVDYDECLNACPVDDEPCLVLCDEAYDDCLATTPTPCSDALDVCFDECSGQLPCEDACYDTYDSCVLANCDTDHTTCLGSCTARQGACATVAG